MESMMLTTNVLINNLVTEIQKDIVLSRTLTDLLAAERAALETKNLEQLENLSTKKILILGDLNTNQISRDAIQVQLGGSPGFVGLKSIIEKYNLKQHPVCKNILHELEKLLVNINKLTEINGKIIAISQAQTARVIDIIYGRENSVYGEDAKVYSTGIANTILKA